MLKTSTSQSLIKAPTIIKTRLKSQLRALWRDCVQRQLSQRQTRTFSTAGERTRWLSLGLNELSTCWQSDRTHYHKHTSYHWILSVSLTNAMRRALSIRTTAVWGEYTTANCNISVGSLLALAGWEVLTVPICFSLNAHSMHDNNTGGSPRELHRMNATSHLSMTEKPHTPQTCGGDSGKCAKVIVRTVIRKTVLLSDIVKKNTVRTSKE